MRKTLAMPLAALALAVCALGVAHASDPLPPETRLVAAATAPATSPPSSQFNIATAEDLVVTFTDLQIPGPLTSAGLVVTQADMIVGQAQVAAPATTATVSIPGASGDYTVYVVGVPGANYSVGTFSVCIAPKANPSNCIQRQSASQQASFSGNITAANTAGDPTVSTLSMPLSVTVAGAYTFNLADLMFPVALNTQPVVGLLQNGSPVIPPGQTSPAIASGTTLNLSAGTYTLLALAQADQTLKSGLYQINIVGPTGSVPLLGDPSAPGLTVPVGLAAAAKPFANPTAQAVTLKVSDYAFPAPLTGAMAVLTSGGAVLGTATAAGGAVNIMAPAGTLYLWTYASAGASAGTYSADVSSSTMDLYTTAQGVGASGNTFAYAFVTNSPLAAGAFQATAADLMFPSTLSGLSFAVAQNGVILQQSKTAGTINFNAVAGNAVILVSAQPPAAGTGSAGDGLFDVNVQTAGASGTPVYDQTQIVSSTPALYDAQALTVGVSGSFDASLTDLKFPVAFSNLALVVSQGSQVLGKIFGGGKFSFSGPPGTYQLTFLATPAAQQQFGLYGVSVVFSPPSVTLSASASSLTTGTPVTLTWTATNASSCTASGGNWTGDKTATGGNEAVVLAATTTYTLTCTGAGGTTAQSVSVTATAAPTKSGGGGALSWGILAALGCLLARRGLARRST